MKALDLIIGPAIMACLIGSIVVVANNSNDMVIAETMKCRRAGMDVKVVERFLIPGSTATCVPITLTLRERIDGMIHQQKLVQAQPVQ